MKYINLFILFFCFDVFAEQTYLIQQVSDAVKNLELINVEPTPVAGESCVVLDDNSDVPAVLSVKTEETKSCYTGSGAAKDYSELLPGQHRLNRKSTWRRSSGPLKGLPRGIGAGDYLMRRLADKNNKPQYQAVLNLNFVGTTGLNQYMYQKTKTCMSDLSPYLKGPNGESLDIKIVTPNEKLPGLPKINPVNIDVLQGHTTFRGHSREFGSNFNCTTVGHEIMHHLGLCDEYHETVEPLKSKFSCRFVTAQPSFMRSMHTTMDMYVPQTNRCECGTSCQKIMKNPAARKIYLSMNGFDYISQENSLKDICTRSETPEFIANTFPEKPFELAKEEGNTFTFNSYEVASPSESYSRTTYNCKCPPGVSDCSNYLNEIRKPNPDLSLFKGSAYCPSKNAAPESIKELPSGKAVDLVSGDGNEFSFTIARESAKTEGVHKSVFTCNCDPSIEYCKKHMDMLKRYAASPKPRAKCPVGSKPKIPEPLIGQDGATRVEGSGDNATLVIATPGDPSKSLLQPQQFKKILAGNCQGAAPGYEICESFSIISKDKKEDAEACAKRPAYCNDDDVFFGNKSVPQ